MKKPVCDKCGLCCKLLIVEAIYYDVLREPRIAAAVPLSRSISLQIADLDSICWTPVRDGACVFLRRDNTCDIYATRPLQCVLFQAGSEKCQGLRRDNGLPPLELQDVSADAVAEIQSNLLAEESA